MDTRNDEQLMAAIMMGEENALTTLVVRYHKPLFGYLYRLVGGNYALAEDIVQETFLRLLQPNGYQHSRTFKPWLYAIATNLVRDHFKSAATRHVLWKDEETLQGLYDTSPGPEERALALEEARTVAIALTQLSEEYRSALLLRFYSELSLQEIAETLHIPLGTVKSRLSVGIRRLKERLTAVGGTLRS